jgi:hypothetical protein
MSMCMLVLLMLVALSAIGAATRRTLPVTTFMCLGIGLTSCVAVSAYCLWIAAHTTYRLSAEGLHVRYGPHHRHYRWEDFSVAYLQRGLLPMRLAFQPVTRFSEVLTLQSRHGDRMLDLTPQDTAGFMRQISVFAPQLAQAASR